jgi:hypothetical protein
MREFTRDEIDQWREVFKSRKYPNKKATLDSRVVDYFVIPASLFQGIPNGLFRMTGKPNDGYVVGVSTEVPIEIQTHFAVSEHDEFMIFGLADQRRTLHSERNMLRIIGESDIKPAYVSNKLKLYEYLLENARGNLDIWGFTNEDFTGFVNAVDYLKSAS